MTEREDKRMDDLVAQVNHGFARVADESSALRREIQGLRVELKGEIQGVRSELKAEIQDVRGEIHGLRVELKAEIQDVRGEIHGLRVELKDEMNQGFERIDGRFDRMHHWAVAIVVAMLGLIGANVLQTLGG